MDNPLYITSVIILLIILLFVFASFGSRKVSQRRRNDIYRQLKDIKGNIGLEINSANRDSIVRLDSLLSKVLQYKNSNKLMIGENLKLIRKRVKQSLYEDIWYYHKLRNRIVHENVEVTKEETKLAYEVYYKLITQILG